LRHVVTEGTGKAAAVPGYPVAGKTGTAQVALSNGLGYAKGKYISSFIGYLPANDPQLLIEVKLDEPSNAIYGGVVAAPTFSSLAQFCCEHLRIPPTDAPSVDMSSTVAASAGASASVGASESVKRRHSSTTASTLSTHTVNAGKVGAAKDGSR